MAAGYFYSATINRFCMGILLPKIDGSQKEKTLKIPSRSSQSNRWLAEIKDPKSTISLLTIWNLCLHTDILCCFTFEIPSKSSTSSTSTKPLLDPLHPLHWNKTPSNLALKPVIKVPSLHILSGRSLFSLFSKRMI